MAIPVVVTVTTPSMSLGSKPAPFDRAAGDIEEQGVGGFEIDPVALRPAVVLAVPVDRRDDVALVDAGIVEHARQPVEQRLAAEQLASGGLGFALVYRIRVEPRRLARVGWAERTKETSDAASFKCKRRWPRWRWSRAADRRPRPNNQAAGEAVASDGKPFTTRAIADFEMPWAMSFLPGSGVPLTKMALITEKSGQLWLVDVASGRKQAVSGVPAVKFAGQGGLGDVVAASRLRRQPARLSELCRSGRGRDQRRGARLWHAEARAGRAADRRVQGHLAAGAQGRRATAISPTASPSRPTGRSSCRRASGRNSTRRRRSTAISARSSI